MQYGLAESCSSAALRIALSQRVHWVRFAAGDRRSGASRASRLTRRWPTAEGSRARDRRSAQGDQEQRVPRRHDAGGVREFVAHGHTVLVEKSAGEGSSFTDARVRSRAGAELVDTADEVFARADMIVKVKEPQAGRDRACCAPARSSTPTCTSPPTTSRPMGLVESGAVCIAYETVELPNRSLPLLAPMSEVAGRMAAQVGATYLQKPNGGRGVLMGGVPGVLPAKVVVLGARRRRHQRRLRRDGHGRGRHRHGRQPRPPALPRRALGQPHPHALLAASTTSSRRSTRPTSSSAPCCCRAPRRRGSSRRTCCRT